jgi:hypothetical protein
MNKTRLLGLINTILTGLLAFSSWFIFASSFQEATRCEFCYIMWFPATLFSLLVLPGIYALFNGKQKSTSHTTLLNTLNIIAITLSVLALIFNFIA